MDNQPQPHPQPSPTSRPPEPVRPPSPPKPPRSFLRELLSTFGILVVAFIFALFLITFVFQSYSVDGSSMEKTLQNQNRLIVWKLPRSWARVTHNQYVPNRGDIIIFNESNLAQFGQPDDRQLIKRVMGLPGERVVVRDGTLTIYNKANPNGFQPDKTLGYGKTGNVASYTSGDIDMTLAANQLFVCGDNRPNSLDSRIFGAINTDQVVGKLVLRVVPLSEAKFF